MRRIQKEEFMGISTSAAANISTISYTMYSISSSAAADISTISLSNKKKTISYTMYKYVQICANISTISYTMYSISSSAAAATTIYSTVAGHDIATDSWNYSI